VDSLSKKAKDKNIQRIWALAVGRDIYQPSKEEKQDSKDLFLINGLVVQEVASSSGKTRIRTALPLCVQRFVAERVIT